jgi:hypothetical protein
MKKEKRLGYIELSSSDIKHHVYRAHIVDKKGFGNFDTQHKSVAKHWAKQLSKETGKTYKLYEVILREVK